MDTQTHPALAQRLIDSAIDHFGRHGFDGSSTRHIAAAGGTTMSSITYHFGGKLGLYLACADNIADQMGLFFAPALQQIAQDPPRSASAARALLLTMIEGFARRMLAPESATLAQFMVREQQQPTEAFERLYQKVIGRVLDAALGLVKLARPSLDDQRRRTLVMNLIGMALALRLARATTTRIMQVCDLDEATCEILIAGLRDSAQALLTEE